MSCLGKFGNNLVYGLQAMPFPLILFVFPDSFLLNLSTHEFIVNDDSWGSINGLWEIMPEEKKVA